MLMHIKLLLLAQQSFLNPITSLATCTIAFSHMDVGNYKEERSGFLLADLPCFAPRSLWKRRHQKHMRIVSHILCISTD